MGAMMAITHTFDTITLSEFAVGTVDPEYTFGGIIADGSDFVVTFDGQIVNDVANTTSPSIAFDTSYQGPVSIKFSHGVSKIEFDAGGFNNVGSTRIALFGRNGFKVEQVLNTKNTGPYEHFAFDFGENVITRIRFIPVAGEDAGFAVDNISIGLKPESKPIALSGND